MHLSGSVHEMIFFRPVKLNFWRRINVKSQQSVLLILYHNIKSYGNIKACVESLHKSSVHQLTFSPKWQLCEPACCSPHNQIHQTFPELLWKLYSSSLGETKHYPLWKVSGLLQEVEFPHMQHFQTASCKNIIRMLSYTMKSDKFIK